MENLVELKREELQDVNGGHWYCELAAQFVDFCEGFADGFDDGFVAGRKTKPESWD